MLNKPGNLTAFTPNNAAFARLPKESLEKLLKDKNLLLDILKEHVLATKVLSKDLKEGTNRVTNLLGKELQLIKKGAEVTIISGSRYDAKVVKADIMASNGVVHVIDTVL